MRRLLLVVPLLAFSLLAIDSSAIAVPVALDRPTSVSVIQDGRGAARVLFRLESIAPREHTAVSQAVLRIPFIGEAAERDLRLRVYPVTRPWAEGAVDWYSGWEKPGGDFNEDVYIAFDVDLRELASQIEIDLTPLAKEITESGLQAEGFIVTTDPEESEGLSLADVDRLQQMGQGSLTFSSRQVPTKLPGSRGDRAGKTQGKRVRESRSGTER